ncbi:expressed unknown protein [Seminavis robusta]|uniref:BTB domain-containing protein n=1 Tax=Seminavis robusta TaxID=568900 RepID=A0A9N8F121_9STRA|nr:expressed unknown protein [Seminavis robusta]|eukprot:Sro2552_g330990.1 n/a (401) ;mRNA; r:6784-7986
MASLKNDDNDKEVSLKEMLASFLTDEALNDVSLKGSDGEVVSANRFILSARSPVFRGMFLGKFREASSPVVQLDFQGNILMAVVEYILTDAAKMVNCKKRKSTDSPVADSQQIQALASLAEAAVYFHLPGLRKSVLAKFEEIWDADPCSSFAIFQAFKVAFPSMSPMLAEKAMSYVRTTPFKSIRAEHVDCLSSDVLEEILKDKKMETTEYQLFQIIVLWRKGDDKRLMAAKDLTKHISFKKIEPELLSTTITASGLVKIRQLCQAFKHQALQLKKASSSPTSFSTVRYNPWTTLFPAFGVNPTEIKVVGAGSEVVNGIYKKSGSHWLIHTKHRTQEFRLHRGHLCDHDRFRITAATGLVGSRKSFYTVRSQGNTDIPPSKGWESIESGTDPPPKLYYKF